jgi:hypothetical protein
VNLLEKLSSYNFITNLVPGVLLTEALRASGVPFAGSDKLAAWLLLSYYLGLVSNRLGSLAVEPILRKSLIRKNNTYEEFVRAQCVDTRLDVLVETANGYRTVLAACLLYVIILIAYALLRQIDAPEYLYVPLSVLCTFALFLISYRKQDSYISRRVRFHCDGDA